MPGWISMEVYLVLKSSIKVEINNAQSNYSLQDVKVESIVKARVGRNSLAWLLLIHSLLQMVLPESMATHAFCHALYEWEKSNKNMQTRREWGWPHAAYFLACLRILKVSRHGLESECTFAYFRSRFYHSIPATLTGEKTWRTLSV